ncbi:MAG: transposase, partial [Prevotellaceae bacterium]|nr:transposase [Prevotellaceae bacterium]
MEKKIFIGIDFSKKTFDVSVIHRSNPGNVPHRQFENTSEGCSALLRWMKDLGAGVGQEWLFCGEHTGLYSMLLSAFLVKRGLFLWLENPLQIKLCTGIKRDKSDKLDSRDIALYALRYHDRAKCYQLPQAALKSLGLLLSFRERLVRNKRTLLVSSGEIRTVLHRDSTARYIYEQSMRDVERINKEIKDIERKMLALIHSDECLRENYTLICSMKGIALINTVMLLVSTQNFTGFSTSRQFCCYAGLAPFGS